MCPKIVINVLAPPTYEDLKELIFKGDASYNIKKIDDLI